MILATISITVFFALVVCALIGMVPPRRRSAWPYAAERQPTAEPHPFNAAAWQAAIDHGIRMQSALHGRTTVEAGERRADLERT